MTMKKLIIATSVAAALAGATQVFAVGDDTVNVDVFINITGSCSFNVANDGGQVIGDAGTGVGWIDFGDRVVGQVAPAPIEATLAVGTISSIGHITAACAPGTDGARVTAFSPRSTAASGVNTSSMLGGDAIADDPTATPPVTGVPAGTSTIPYTLHRGTGMAVFNFSDDAGAGGSEIAIPGDGVAQVIDLAGRTTVPATAPTGYYVDHMRLDLWIN